MTTIQVMSPWQGTGTIDDPYMPLVAARHRVAARLMSAEAQYHARDMVQVECTDEQLELIEADPDIQVMRPRTPPPDAAVPEMPEHPPAGKSKKPK